MWGWSKGPACRLRFELPTGAKGERTYAFLFAGPDGEQKGKRERLA